MDLTIAQGEFVFIVGQSGAGKSTLLKLLIAEEKPTEGKVFLDGKEITALPHNDLLPLRRRIGTVFQDFKPLTQKTAYENVALRWKLRVGAKRNRRRCATDITAGGLEQKGAQFPSELSGGEQQRVAIARALAHQPDIIIADEPTEILIRSTPAMSSAC